MAPRFDNSDNINYLLSNNTSVKLRIIDTAGQERFRSISITSFKNADSFILVYDITNKRSFEVCEEFSKIIKENCGHNNIVFLVGNKLDYKRQREVSVEEGIEFAESHGFHFYETSCKTNENVQIVLQNLVEETVRRKELSYEYKNFVVLKKNSRNTDKNKKHCC